MSGEHQIFLYKTTNLVNDKFYIGIHTGPVEGETTGRLYLGSGILLVQALKKHGRSNFKREVLEVFEDYETAFNREAEVVNEDLIKNPLCYNLKPGGRGGRNMTPEQRKKIGDSRRGKKQSETTKLKRSETMRGVPKSEEHKARMRHSKVMKHVTCPNCGTSGTGANMSRYHFGNCKGLSKKALRRLKNEKTNGSGLQ